MKSKAMINCLIHENLPLDIDLKTTKNLNEEEYTNQSFYVTSSLGNFWFSIWQTYYSKVIIYAAH